LCSAPVLPSPAVKSFETGLTRLETLTKAGRKPVHVPLAKVEDRIHAAQLVLPKCLFDSIKCEQGLAALREFRRLGQGLGLRSKRSDRVFDKLDLIGLLGPPRFPQIQGKFSCALLKFEERPPRPKLASVHCEKGGVFAVCSAPCMPPPPYSIYKLFISQSYQSSHRLRPHSSPHSEAG
jgi:hypothetical protein